MTDRPAEQILEDAIGRMIANAATPAEAQVIEAAWKGDTGGDLFKTNAPKFNQRWLESTMIRQSLIFYNDLLPVLFQCCGAIWRGEPLNVCDIGSNVCAGGAHLSDVLNNLTGYKVRVSCFDTDARYADYARVKFPQVEFMGGDFFADPRRFDIALCSHTLEHIPAPGAFVERVLERVEGSAIFYVPYNEQNFIPGHVNRFDDELIASMPGVVWASVVRSVGWRADGEASRCAVFVCLPEAQRRNVGMIEALRAKLDDELSARSLTLR